MSNAVFASYLIRDVEEQLRKGDVFEASDSVAARFSGHGSAWTWEVDELHRNPQNDGERKLSDKLDDLLLLLANKLYMKLPVMIRISNNPDQLFNRVSQLVLCLNRLGGKAPRDLVNCTYDKIDSLARSDKSRAEVYYSLIPFLPGMRYNS